MGKYEELLEGTKKVAKARKKYEYAKVALGVGAVALTVGVARCLKQYDYGKTVETIDEFSKYMEARTSDLLKTMTFWATGMIGTTAGSTDISSNYFN